MFIPFAKPDIGPCEVYAVSKVLKSGHLTTGDVTEKFEKEFAEYVGSKYAVFLNSCTSAIKLALLYKKQAEHDLVQHWGVLVPSMTFVSTVTEIIEVGMVPHFGDIDKKTMCMNELEKMQNSKIKLVLPVHFGGHEAPDYGKGAIYDSAHLVKSGCHRKGSTSCYSFYPTKNMTTGEGGMLCTDDKNEYEWVKRARHHGRSSAIGDSDVLFKSSKYNNTDIAAAIGREQLRTIESRNKKRDELVKEYNKIFMNGWHGNHLYVIRVRDREKFIKEMLAADIQCSIHFRPVHTMTAYDYWKNENLPITNKIKDEIVSLPLYSSLTKGHIEYIANTAMNTKKVILPQ